MPTSALFQKYIPEKGRIQYQAGNLSFLSFFYLSSLCLLSFFFCLHFSYFSLFFLLRCSLFFSNSHFHSFFLPPYPAYKSQFVPTSGLQACLQALSCLTARSLS